MDEPATVRVNGWCVTLARLTDAERFRLTRRLARTWQAAQAAVDMLHPEEER